MTQIEQQAEALSKKEYPEGNYLNDIIDAAFLQQAFEKGFIAGSKATQSAGVFGSWVDINENGYPTYVHGSDDNDYWISYERDGKEIIEMGYMCGDDLFKGSTERYPYPSHFIKIPKPLPPGQSPSPSLLQQENEQLRKALGNIKNNFEHEDYGNKSENCPVCIATEALNQKS